MKKIIIMMIFVSVSILETSCTTVKAVKDTINNQQHAQEVSEKIVQYINEEDVEELKKLFNAYMKDSSELNNDIEELIDCFDGEIVSFETDYNGETGSMDNGEWTIQMSETELEDVKTDSGKAYRIVFEEYIVYVNDKNREGGINSLSVQDEEGEVLCHIFYE